MGRIKVLDDHLIDRIAAGEVVERPSSVVKELLENSLDAGARSIDVALEGGGRRLIRVADDGTGMDRDDALLAVERHATSKLGRSSDLDAIGTLGFRGEALSSIAAVSQFVLQTATRDGSGTEVVARGGRIQSVQDAGLPRGTLIQVERLFFNVPARRKFLRAESTELSHIVRWLTRYALAYREVRFHLTHGGRVLLQAPPADSRQARLAQVFGEEFVAKLLPFDRRQESLRVTGFAGRPVETLPGREAQHVFVNGRAVQDRVLAHAVGDAYGNTMARGRHPALFLFLELEPADVDVNVHPQKTEVRFRKASLVHDFVRDSVASALCQSGAVPAYSDLRPGTRAGASGVAEATLRYLQASEQGSVAAGGASSRTWSGEPASGVTPPGQGFIESQPQPPVGRTIPEIGEDRVFPLAQYLDSYVIARDEQGLMLVDQHAAHERVIFERYLAQAEENQVEVQRLMFPVTLELAPHEQLLLESEIDEFRRLGFMVEPFGGRTVRIDGVPALGADLDPEQLVRELLGEAARASAATSEVGELRRRLVTSAACQAAIKIHHPLAKPAMQSLLDDLFATAKPTTCPHGRPAVFRLSLEEIERAFRRR